MSDPSGKRLAVDANEALRAYVQSIVDERYDGKKARFADAIGVAQATVQEFLGSARAGGRASTRGAGMTLLTALAKFTGKSIDELASGRVGTQTVLLNDTRPVYSSLPGWHTELELAKRERPNMQPRGWGYAAQQNALFMMSVTAKDIIEAAEFWMRRASEHEQNEAAVERTEVSLAAHEARQVEAQRRIAEMKKRGEPNVPSLAAMMKVAREEQDVRALAEAKEKDASPANDAPPPAANDTPAKVEAKKGRAKK